MSMLCGLDLHRRQITFDALVPETGEAWRGRIWSPDRDRLRAWLAAEVAPRAGAGPVDIAVEGCTGWRYVVEEVEAAGFRAHLADPAETQAARGRKKRAKTDRRDARLACQLLAEGRLPESWVPPSAVLEWRERARLYKSLADQRRRWVQRLHAECFQHGLAVPGSDLRTKAVRESLLAQATGLSPVGRQRIETAYRMVDATHAEMVPLARQFYHFGYRQAACRALWQSQFGIGYLVSVIVWAELGDCRRFSRSDQVVRHAGLDVTVHESDLHRPGGQLSREGPGTLRWALFESAKSATKASSPDHAYYQAVRERRGGKVATLSVARKLILRCYHVLRSLSPEVVYTMPPG
jgi:transposase